MASIFDFTLMKNIFPCPQRRFDLYNFRQVFSFSDRLHDVEKHHCEKCTRGSLYDFLYHEIVTVSTWIIFPWEFRDFLTLPR